MGVIGVGKYVGDEALLKDYDSSVEARETQCSSKRSIYLNAINVLCCFQNSNLP